MQGGTGVASVGRSGFGSIGRRGLGSVGRRGLGSVRRVSLLGLAAVVLATGCGGSDAVDRVQAAALGARIDAIEAQLRVQIGPAACTSDSDCRALPIGARACGGPDRFLPYSVRATDEAALARLAADHARLSAELLREQGAVGACVVAETPTAYCERSAPLACKLR